jgi:hypothetical protein
MAIAKHSKNSSISNNNPNPTLFKFEIPSLDNGIHVPRLGDIWILGS